MNTKYIKELFMGNLQDYFRFEIRSVPDKLGKTLRFDFYPGYHSMETYLHYKSISFYIPDEDFVKYTEGQLYEVVGIYTKSAAQEIMKQVFEETTAFSQLKQNFWSRLKFLFTGRIKLRNSNRIV